MCVSLYACGDVSGRLGCLHNSPLVLWNGWGFNKCSSGISFAIVDAEDVHRRLEDVLGYQMRSSTGCLRERIVVKAVGKTQNEL